MYENIGQTIKEARTTAGKTRAECAALASVSAVTWLRWELGRKRCQPDRVLAAVDGDELRAVLAAVVVPVPQPKSLAGPAVCPAQALLWMERRSVSALALAQSLGVDHKTVYRWLRGESRPKPFVCTRILATIPACAKPLLNLQVLVHRCRKRFPVAI